MRRELAVALLAAAGIASAATADAHQDILARLDQAAAAFRTMTAEITYTTHTAVLNEDDTEQGRVVMKKLAPGEVEGLMEYMKPDHKLYLFQKGKLQVYTPNDNTVTVYDLGKQGAQIDQFLALGFGTSSKDLQAGFQVTPAGPAALNGKAATKVDLVPTTEQGKKLLTKIELWIGPDAYPLQEKLYQPSGDYSLIRYDNVKINPPLAADALKLETAPGVKYEYPQK